MDVVQRGAAQYAAFISYSHRDAALGRWLHRRLEGYRLPRRLAGSQGERGLVPQRLTPIFRDREELPAAGDLSERVRAALQVSGSLIVLCSPHAAASLWVAKEIETFRALHPDRPVLAAIVDGQPSDCFPPALRSGATGEIEPLAADFRKDADGRRLALLKLVAGIAGVGLDQLVQRDAQRRLRRVTAVTLAALGGMLVTAALAIIAVNARAEAQRQRAKAEGLVEFMLTDLRDRLRGVGRLDVLTAVNRRALQYYGGRSDLDASSDESLARRARIFHAMGEDRLDRHDMVGALAAYREAGRTTGEQLSRAPMDAGRLLDHSRSVGGIGRVYEQQEDWEQARRHYLILAALADRLIDTDPRNPDHLAKAAAAAVDLGNVDLRGTRQFAAAQRSYRRAVMHLDRADAARPNDHHLLLSKANALGWLADSYYYQDLWTASLAARSQQYSIVARLHEEEPDNRLFSFFLAAAERGLAYSELKTGREHQALIHLAAARRRIDALTELDPRNAKWRALQAKLRADQIGAQAEPRRNSPIHEPGMQQERERRNEQRGGTWPARGR